MRVSLKDFPSTLRPAIRVFLGAPRPDSWAQAVKLSGKRNEKALAKALVGRRRPPFFDVNLFLEPAARALAGEPELLALAAEDLVEQLAALSGARMGDGSRIASIRKLIPSSLLSEETRARMRRLAADRRYKPIASALRGWAGRGESAPDGCALRCETRAARDRSSCGVRSRPSPRRESRPASVGRQFSSRDGSSSIRSSSFTNAICFFARV